MTTLSTLANEAFRESNLIAVGTTATAAELAEGVTLLNRYIQTLFGNEAGERLQTIAIGTEGVETPSLVHTMDAYLPYYLPENSRIHANLSEEVVVNLPPTPHDGARMAVVDNASNFATYNMVLQGNGRKIETATNVVLSTNGLTREWFYREDTGNWSRLSALVAADESPFPGIYDDLLIIGTAARLNPRQGSPLDPLSSEMYRSLMSKFKTQYKQTRDVGVDIALLNLGRSSQATGLGGSLAFQRGVVRW